MLVLENIQDLRTPAFLIDLPVLKRNSQRMTDMAHQRGVRLRPHTKTHKTLKAARIQTEGGFQGLTVSTLIEAEYYKGKGFKDITYAFPIHPAKLG
ncbi:MAG: alanine racemase, partial [Acidobacteriota bacterium]